MLMAAIEVCGISKRYGSVEAMRDVTFNVEQGEIFGIIYPDGAGKTSLYRIMATLLLPDAGSAKIMGNDVISDMMEIRRSVGYILRQILTLSRSYCRGERQVFCYSLRHYA